MIAPNAIQTRLGKHIACNGANPNCDRTGWWNHKVGLDWSVQVWYSHHGLKGIYILWLIS